MDSPFGLIDDSFSAQILVVDDNNVSRALHRTLLAQHFDVVTAASGAEALDICRTRLPDLVLLDIEMPGLDGIATCRHLRELTSIPVIFVTGHMSFDEHIRAYDAGGNDLVTKPVHADILLRKTFLAIRQHRAKSEIVAEKQSLQQIAMGLLSSMGQSGMVLNFVRASIGCRTYADLAQKLLECTAEMGVECTVALRHTGGPTILTPHGLPSALEIAILEQCSEMGRVFQFRQRLIDNYAHVSILVANMPDERDEAERAGRIRDSIAILAETADTLCENVGMRIESMERAELLQVALGSAAALVEELRMEHQARQYDARLLLESIVHKIEASYKWLGTSEDQEAEISSNLQVSIDEILSLIAEGGDFDQKFNRVLDALRGGTTEDSMEFF